MSHLSASAIQKVRPLPYLKNKNVKPRRPRLPFPPQIQTKACREKVRPISIRLSADGSTAIHNLWGVP